VDSVLSSSEMVPLTLSWSARYRPVIFAYPARPNLPGVVSANAVLRPVTFSRLGVNGNEWRANIGGVGFGILSEHLHPRARDYGD
jgi:hypothetical protein